MFFYHCFSYIFRNYQYIYRYMEYLYVCVCVYVHVAFLKFSFTIIIFSYIFLNVFLFKTLYYYVYICIYNSKMYIAFFQCVCVKINYYIKYILLFRLFERNKIWNKIIIVYIFIIRYPIIENNAYF